MKKDDITPDLLRRRLEFFPETGALIWRPVAVPQGRSSGFFRRWNEEHAGKVAFTYSDHLGYHRGSVGGVMLLAHRVAWAIYHGHWPSGQIDHIDGDPANNRLCNLRDVTPAENCKNTRRRSGTKTGVTGVTWHTVGKRFHASINVDRRAVYLGMFDTLEQAAEARRAAERKYGFHENHGRPPGRAVVERRNQARAQMEKLNGTHC